LANITAYAGKQAWQIQQRLFSWHGWRKILLPIRGPGKTDVANLRFAANAALCPMLKLLILTKKST
jgi:hypothetical protein